MSECIPVWPVLDYGPVLAGRQVGLNGLQRSPSTSEILWSCNDIRFNIYLILPSLALNHVPLHHTYVSFKHLSPDKFQQLSPGPKMKHSTQEVVSAVLSTGEQSLPGAFGHISSDTAHNTSGLFGHLSKLLAHVDLAVRQHPLGFPHLQLICLKSQPSVWYLMWFGWTVEQHSQTRLTCTSFGS